MGPPIDQIVHQLLRPWAAAVSFGPIAWQGLWLVHLRMGVRMGALAKACSARKRPQGLHKLIGMNISEFYCRSGSRTLYTHAAEAFDHLGCHCHFVWL